MNMNTMFHESTYICQAIDDSQANIDMDKQIAEKRNNKPFCPHCGVVPFDTLMASNSSILSEWRLFPSLVIIVFGIVATVYAMSTLEISIPLLDTWTRQRQRFLIQSTNTTILSNKFVSSVCLSTILITFTILAYNTYHTQNHSPVNSINETRQGFIQDALKQLTGIKKSKWGDNITMYYAQILSQLIQCETISYDTSLEIHPTDDKDTLLFQQQALLFHSILETSFPILHTQFPPKKIASFSLVYEIIPPNYTNHRKPILFCSHLDVVPASYKSKDDMEGWIQAPFSGKIVDDCIWGRGGSYFILLIKTL